MMMAAGRKRTREEIEILSSDEDIRSAAGRKAPRRGGEGGHLDDVDMVGGHGDGGRGALPAVGAPSSVEALVTYLEDAVTAMLAQLGQDDHAAPMTVARPVPQCMGTLAGSLTLDGVLPLAAVQQLVEALATTVPDRRREAVRHIASSLFEIRSSLDIKLPRSIEVLEKARFEGRSGHGQEDPGQLKKVDERHKEQLEKCSAVLRRYSQLEEDAECMETYVESYSDTCKSQVKVKQQMAERWRLKLEDHKRDVDAATTALAGIDKSFESLVLASHSKTNASETPTSLSIISSILDVTGEDKHRDMMNSRKDAAESLTRRQRERDNVAERLRIVEGLFAVVQAMADGGRKKVHHGTAAFLQAKNNVSQQVELQLREELERATALLQELIEHHETRKGRAAKAAALRQHELETHLQLFANETPAEQRHLESCVKELQALVAASQAAIDKAIDLNKALVDRVQHELPSDVADRLRPVCRPPAARACSDVIEIGPVDRVLDLDPVATVPLPPKNPYDTGGVERPVVQGSVKDGGCAVM